MDTFTDLKQEKKSQPAALSSGKGQSAALLTDNRPNAIMQRKLLDGINNSFYLKQTAQLQEQEADHDFLSSSAEPVVQRVINWTTTGADAGFMMDNNLTADAGKLRIMNPDKIKKVKQVEDRTSEYPPSLLAYAQNFINVAPNHRDAYNEVVRDVLDYLRGLSTPQRLVNLQGALRETWKNKLRTIPVAAPDNPDLFSTAQVAETLLAGHYTLATVLINNEKVFQKRNEEDDGHAEAQIIQELNKDVNWEKWQQDGILVDSGNQIRIIINNSPCFYEAGCAGALAAEFNRIKLLDPDTQLTVAFANAYEAVGQNFDDTGFKKSMDTLRAAGIGVEAFDATAYVNAKKAELQQAYNINDQGFEAYLTERKKKDSATAGRIDQSLL